MDLELTDDQSSLRDELRRFLSARVDKMAAAYILQGAIDALTMG